MKNNFYLVTLRTIYPNIGFGTREEIEVFDELVHERLELRCKSPLVAFVAGEESKSVSLFNWHQRIGHRSMKAITGMALKNILDDILKFYSCTSWALTKSWHFPTRKETQESCWS